MAVGEQGHDDQPERRLGADHGPAHGRAEVLPESTRGVLGAVGLVRGPASGPAAVGVPLVAPAGAGAGSISVSVAGSSGGWGSRQGYARTAQVVQPTRGRAATISPLHSSVKRFRPSRRLEGRHRCGRCPIPEPGERDGSLMIRWWHELTGLLRASASTDDAGNVDAVVGRLQVPLIRTGSEGSLEVVDAHLEVAQPLTRSASCSAV